MSISLNIKRYAGTEASLLTLVGAREFAIGSDTDKCYFGNSAGTRVYLLDNEKYYDGSMHYTDKTMNNADIQGYAVVAGDLKPAEYIKKNSAPANYIRLESDKISVIANGAGGFFVEDDRCYSTASMSVGSDSITTTAINITKGMSLDNRCFTYTDNVAINSGADQFNTFRLGGNTKVGGYVDVSIGGYFSDDEPYARQVVNSFLLDADALGTNTQVEIFETVASAVSVSLYATGSNNSIDIYLHNNDTHNINCTLEYKFVLHNSTGVSK